MYIFLRALPDLDFFERRCLYKMQRKALRLQFLTAKNFHGFLYKVRLLIYTEDEHVYTEEHHVYTEYTLTLRHELARVLLYKVPKRQSRWNLKQLFQWNWKVRDLTRNYTCNSAFFCLFVFTHTTCHTTCMVPVLLTRMLEYMTTYLTQGFPIFSSPVSCVSWNAVHMRAASVRVVGQGKPPTQLLRTNERVESSAGGSGRSRDSCPAVGWMRRCVQVREREGSL